MLPLSHIVRPTCLLNKTRVLQNIRKMTQKADINKVTLRPHFKTHQSATVGQWFRIFGVKKITVSSVAMARYFAENGWDDITIAFPVNVREIDSINELAESIRLQLLVDSTQAVTFLQQNLRSLVSLWIKIDVGYGRAGIRYDNVDLVKRLYRQIVRAPETHFAGLLTHAGHTYNAASVEEIRHIYRVSVERLNRLRRELQALGAEQVLVSVGDTPGCTLIEDFGQVDEIRPGNFVFYDVMQMRLGVCTEEQIGIAVACPVVSVYPEREEMVLYGGAVHLSNDFVVDEQGNRMYGLIAPLEAKGWGASYPGAYLRSVSQEHGVVRAPAAVVRKYRVGDLVAVLPVHSCLTANLLKRYLTLDGEPIDMAPI